VHWVDTYGLSAAEIAMRMREARIDVLIHPCTFKARYRTILAHRAAPLQIAGINFVSTTGLTATDYVVGDDVLTPLGDSDVFFTERLLRLRSFNCYGVPDYAPPVGELPAHRNGFLTFGSLNNPAKLGARAIETWAAVFARLPTARLLLKHRAFDDAAVRSSFVRRFASYGIADTQLAFAGFTADPGGYLASYHEIDVALDSMPFNGGTTSYEAIWMGVPVLTLAGDLLMARQSASLMTAAGHPEFVSDTEQTFVDKALALSEDVAGLAKIRAGLRASAARTIFNAEAYTRDLEAAVRAAWRTLCSARP
jgi:predicted O-linked N-acetylglucosamine transferase (SPINDLY family)